MFCYGETWIFKSLQMVFPKACLTYYSSPINTCTSNTASPVHLMSLPAILAGILVLVVVAPLLQAQPLIPSGNSNNFEYKRYCSNSLSDVIRLLCGGPYNSQQYAQYSKFPLIPLNTKTKKTYCAQNYWMISYFFFFLFCSLFFFLLS